MSLSTSNIEWHQPEHGDIHSINNLPRHSAARPQLLICAFRSLLEWSAATHVQEPGWVSDPYDECRKHDPTIDQIVRRRNGREPPRSASQRMAIRAHKIYKSASHGKPNGYRPIFLHGHVNETLSRTSILYVHRYNPKSRIDNSTPSQTIDFAKK